MSYNYSLLFAQIFKHMKENPATSIGRLAGELGISRRTIQHVVNAQSGKTFNAVREDILIERVRQLFISQPRLSIKEVSFTLGFRSPRSFGRALKRLSRFSPGEFRSSLSHPAESRIGEGSIARD